LTKTATVSTLFHKWHTIEDGAVIKENWVLKTLKKLKVFRKTQFSVYDYFTSEEHLKWSLQEAEEVSNRVVSLYCLELNGKSILDVSGGNGIVANTLKQRFGCTVVMTEVNSSAIDYSKSLNIETHFWDFESRTPHFEKKFDVIFLRACIMFLSNLDEFLDKLHNLMAVGGIIVIEHSVHPTLGVFLRVQRDPYTYKILRNPEAVTRIAERNSFRLQSLHTEVDPSNYVYDFDRSLSTRILWSLTSFTGAGNLLKVNPQLRRRERIRSHLTFRRVEKGADI
jgi:2-polyprenyl-3-methyl-5-hydroxy-6-metoxy-1,4-benzoquinol methylase